jgi:hypothetical protein
MSWTVEKVEEAFDYIGVAVMLLVFTSSALVALGLVCYYAVMAFKWWVAGTL